MSLGRIILSSQEAGHPLSAEEAVGRERQEHAQEVCNSSRRPPVLLHFVKSRISIRIRILDVVNVLTRSEFRKRIVHSSFIQIASLALRLEAAEDRSALWIQHHALQVRACARATFPFSPLPSLLLQRSAPPSRPSFPSYPSETGRWQMEDLRRREHAPHQQLLQVFVLGHRETSKVLFKRSVRPPQSKHSPAPRLRARISLRS